MLISSRTIAFVCLCLLSPQNGHKWTKSSHTDLSPVMIMGKLQIKRHKKRSWADGICLCLKTQAILQVINISSLCNNFEYFVFMYSFNFTAILECWLLWKVQSDVLQQTIEVRSRWAVYRHWESFVWKYVKEYVHEPLKWEQLTIDTNTHCSAEQMREQVPWGIIIMRVIIVQACGRSKGGIFTSCSQLWGLSPTFLLCVQMSPHVMQVYSGT